MSFTIGELEAFARGLAADAQRWQSHVDHDPEHRTYALIWDDEDVQAYVLCWSKDHDTGFHDHDISSAAIVVVDGHVREERLCLDGPPKARISGPGETFTVPPNAIHRVLHAGDRPAVTIHAYSPPLARLGAYSLGDDGELLREVQDGEEELRPELAAGA